MRLGSRELLLLCARAVKQNVIFETSVAGDAAGQANIVTPYNQMIEIPPKNAPHHREQPKSPNALTSDLEVLAFFALGPVYTVRTKLQKFLLSYVEGVYTIQNDAYERNGLTAYSVDGHIIVLNWITEITDFLQFFVVSVKFGSDYASREVVLSFW